MSLEEAIKICENQRKWLGSWALQKANAEAAQFSEAIAIIISALRETTE